MTVSKTCVTMLALLVATTGLAGAQTLPGGRPMTWGSGSYGQLGTGLYDDRLVAGRTIRLPKCTALASGAYHTLFLTAGGRVLAAGYNGSGQLGDGSAIGVNRAAPLEVPGITTAVAVAAGAYHSLALLADGTVRAWGYNANGQLGDGTLTDRHTPVPVLGVAGASGIAAGWAHSLASLSNGHVRGWGYNVFGQVGNGTWGDEATPVEVTDLADAVSVAAGMYHSLAVRADGTAAAWGENSYGQLGDGSTTTMSTPVGVSGVVAAKSIGAGSYHSLVVLDGGAVLAWGYNAGGQLGNGSTTGSLLPAPVVGLTTATAVGGGDGHSAARLSDGTVATWGVDNLGVLGNGPGGDTLVPQVVPGLSDVSAIATTYYQCLAVTGDGSVFGWGFDANGQLGEGGYNYRQAPALCCGLDSASQVAMGQLFSLAVREDGALFAWGNNGYGQLGDGTYDSALSPRLISDLPPVAGVAAGVYHSLLLMSDGTIRAAGYGASGQLGQGLMSDSTVPVVVTGISTATSVVAGQYNSYALLADGTVRAWGDNSYGQLGDGSASANSSTPVTVLGLAGTKAIATGGTHALALLAGGSVVSWGDNSNGQLGDGTYDRSNVPVPVTGLSNVVAIAAGIYHSVAVLADGTVVAWGYNGNGQLGDGTGASSPTPVSVSGLTGVTSVACGYLSTLALLADGTVRAWGWNASGQLGDGTVTDRFAPVPVPGLERVTALASGYYASMAVSRWRDTVLAVADRSGSAGQSVSLSAALTADTDPVVSRLVTFSVDGTAVGAGVTDSGGVAACAYVVADVLAVGDHTVLAEFSADEYYRASSGTGVLSVVKGATSISTLDRSGVITTVVTLRGYLKRTSDNAMVVGRTVGFTIDGTSVGSAITDVTGRASLNYTIATTAGLHTIGVDFAGDASYHGSSATGSLTATVVTTKVYVPARSGRIKQRAVLRAFLYTLTNVAIPGKTLSVSVDGTLVGSKLTDSSGRVEFYYTVPEAAGAGARVIRGEWAGNAGYTASAATGTLTVTQGDLYLWVYVRSGKVGTSHPLKAYVRSLPDYAIQPGRAFTFRVNGTDVGSTTVAATGWAIVNWTIPVGEPTGAHTASAVFAGDAWYLAQTKNAAFNVVP